MRAVVRKGGVFKDKSRLSLYYKRLKGGDWRRVAFGCWRRTSDSRARIYSTSCRTRLQAVQEARQFLTNLFFRDFFCLALQGEPDGGEPKKLVVKKVKDLKVLDAKVAQNLCKSSV